MSSHLERKCNLPLRLSRPSGHRGWNYWVIVEKEFFQMWRSEIPHHESVDSRFRVNWDYRERPLLPSFLRHFRSWKGRKHDTIGPHILYSQYEVIYLAKKMWLLYCAEIIVLCHIRKVFHERTAPHNCLLLNLILPETLCPVFESGVIETPLRQVTNAHILISETSVSC